MHRGVSLDAAVAAGILALMAVPLIGPLADRIGLNYPAYVKHAVFQTGVCALAMVWILRRAVAGRAPSDSFKARAGPPAAAPEALLLALVGLGFFSAAWSGLPYIATLGAYTLAWRMAWGLLVSTVDWSGANRRLLFGAILGAGLVSALATLWLHAAGDDAATARVMGHRNFLACFLLPPIVLAAAALFGPRRAARTRALAAPALLTMLAALALCGSWGALVGLLAASATGILWAASPTWRRRLLLAGGVALLAAGAAVALTWDHLRPRLLLSEQSTRYFHAVGALRMIAERPLLGWGAETYMSRFPHFRPVEAGRYGRMTQHSLHPHNEFAAVAIRTGAVGLLLFLCALWIAFERFFRRAARERRAAPLSIAPAAGAVAMLAHGFFEVALSFWGVETMFWALIGYLISAGRPSNGRQAARRRHPSFGTAMAAGVSAVLLLLTWKTFAWDGLVAERAAGLGRDAPPEQATPMLQRSIALQRYVPEYLLSHVYLAQALQAQGRGPEAALAYERLRILAPDLGRLDLELGHFYSGLAERAAPEEAAAYRERAAALYNAMATVRPYYADGVVHKFLARSLLNVSRAHLPQAVRQTRASVLLKPDDPSRHYLLGIYLGQSGAAKEAADALGRSAALRRAEIAAQFGPVCASGVSTPVASAARLEGMAQALLALAGTEYQCAEAAWQAGDLLRAAAAVEACLAIQPDHAGALRLRRRIEGRRGLGSPAR